MGRRWAVCRTLRSGRSGANELVRVYGPVFPGGGEDKRERGGPNGQAAYDHGVPGVGGYDGPEWLWRSTHRSNQPRGLCVNRGASPGNREDGPAGSPSHAYGSRTHMGSLGRGNLQEHGGSPGHPPFRTQHHLGAQETLWGVHREIQRVRVGKPRRAPQQTQTPVSTW